MRLLDVCTISVLRVGFGRNGLGLIKVLLVPESTLMRLTELDGGFLVKVEDLVVELVKSLFESDLQARFV